MATTPTIIGQAVRQRREALVWSRYDLARESGLHHSLIYRIESGATPDPTFGTVCKIADALGLTLDDLRRPPEAEKRASRRKVAT